MVLIIIIYTLYIIMTKIADLEKTRRKIRTRNNAFKK